MTEPDHTLRWAGVTHTGNVRPHNEDAYLLFLASRDGLAILPHEGETQVADHDIILAVSDGMGGAQLGERASAVALHKMGDIIPRAIIAAAQEDGGTGLPDYAAVLSDAIQRVHAAINRESEVYPECRGMGCTLSLVWITADGAFIGHVGDSRVYIHSEGRTIQMSQDHSHVGKLLDSGQINERQARTHPLRSTLTQALGAGIQRITPQISQFDFAPGDRLLLCSDGLTEGLWQKHIEAGLCVGGTSLDGIKVCRDQFLERALEEGGRDNITVVVADLAESGATL